MKIYINEGSFGFDMSPMKKINLISDSPFSGIGLWFEKFDIWINQKSQNAGDFRLALQTKKVDVIEINFLKLLFTHEYDSPELQHEISQGIHYAKLCRAPFLTAATFGENIQQSLYVANIRRLSEKLRQENILLAIEFLPWTEISSITKLQELLIVIDRDNVGILLDTFHFFMGDSDLEALKRIPPKNIFLIHCNDLVDNNELLSELSLIEITRGYRVAPGLGNFPLARLFRTLREMGVEAPVSLEVLNRESTTQRHIDSVLDAYISTLRQMGV